MVKGLKITVAVATKRVIMDILAIQEKSYINKTR